MESDTKRAGQRGFALILSILALMLLTFLGLTLATTTSTELQIATNYRWSQQAYYNAEAGIEAGKIILRGVTPDWQSVLPTARAPWPISNALTQCTAATCGTFAGSRNYEASDCDTRGGIGYGAVLAGNENVTQFMGQPIRGAFSLWVKRDIVPMAPVAGGTDLSDEASNSFLVLVSEGVAPQSNLVGGASLQAARAVRVLQVKLFNGAVARGCQAAEGQTGTTAAGSNFGACAPLDTGSIDQALGGGGGSRADLGAK